MNRVIDIECKASSVVVRDGMRISGIVKRNYGFAGRRFVDELYKYGIIPQVEERYKDLFKLLSDRDTTEKQAMAAAAIICADELACAWVLGGTERPLTVDQISEFLASKATVSAGDRGYKYLCDWVTQNATSSAPNLKTPIRRFLGRIGRRARLYHTVCIRAYSTGCRILHGRYDIVSETKQSDCHEREEQHPGQTH